MMLWNKQRNTEYINQSIRMLIVSSHTVEESAWRKDACLECRAGESSDSPTVQEYDT